MRGEGGIAPLTHTYWLTKVCQVLGAPWHSPLCTQIGYPLLLLDVRVIYTIVINLMKYTT